MGNVETWRGGQNTVDEGITHGSVAEVAIPRHLFADILRMIADLRSRVTSAVVCVPINRVQAKTSGAARRDKEKSGVFPAHQPKPTLGQGPHAGRRRSPLDQIPKPQ
jgi:hypothetical protein